MQHLPEKFQMKSGAEKFPLMVVTSFSYVCNARCPNCPYTNTSIRKDYKGFEFINDNVFKQLSDECGKYHAMIRLTGGGEPMLHPRAVQLIAYAKEVGAKVGLITNGSKFTKANLNELLDVGIDVIELSVDAADKQTYAAVRPGLSWNNLVKNVDCIMHLRDPVKTKVIVSIINQIGIDIPRAKKFWSTKVDNVQIRKFLTWGYNKDASADPTPYLNPNDMIPCPWLFERLNVDSRGDVTFCGEDIAFKNKFANIMTRSIAGIWLGTEFEKLREMHLSYRGFEVEMCKNCPDWKYRSWEYNYWKLLKDA